MNITEWIYLVSGVAVLLLYAVAIGPDIRATQPALASPKVSMGLWAVGRNGTVLRLLDPNRVVSVSTPFDRHYFGVIAPGPGLVRVVGDFGLQLTSDSAGHSWRCVPREEDVILGRIARAGSDALMVGEFGTVERLRAGNLPGESGAIANVPDDLYLFDAWFDDSGTTGVAVGLAGTVLRSEDGGTSWRPIDSGLRADLYGVGGSGDRVAVVGEGGTIAVSEDRGRSFAALSTAIPPIPLHDVAFNESGVAFAVGPRGFIARLDADQFEIVHPPRVAGSSPASAGEAGARSEAQPSEVQP